MDPANDKSKEVPQQAAGPILSDRYALSAIDFGVVCLLVASYLLFYYLPLPTVGVWRDIAVGRSILDQAQLPQHPVQMPLAAAGSYRATNWLADLSLALIDRVGGPEAISLAGTLMVSGYLLFVYFVLCRGDYPQWLKLAAVFLTAATLFFPWQGLSPASASAIRLALFLAPLAIFARWRQPECGPSIWTWIFSPLAIVAWANSHWTFIAGPMLMTAIACGVIGDGLFAGKSLRETLATSSVQAWVWLAQICWFVTLLNPFGFGVWAEAFAQITHPLDGSGPLVLASGLGGIVIVQVIAFACLLRMSRVPFRTGDALLLVVAGIMAALNIHFVLAFVAVATIVCLPLTRGMFATSAAEKKTETSSLEQRPLRFAFTLLSLLAIWIGFALSPISAAVLGGTPRTLAQAVDDAPLGVVNYLNEHQQPRFVFAPVAWSDWIAYATADSPNLFATSDFDRLPQQAQFDYRRLVQGGAQWKRVLDRYAVDTLVIDKRTQADFATQALGDVDQQWQLAWESDRALILQRRID